MLWHNEKWATVISSDEFKTKQYSMQESISKYQTVQKTIHKKTVKFRGQNNVWDNMKSNNARKKKYQ